MAEPKFKVGDKVRVTIDRPSEWKGDEGIGTITKVFDSRVHIKWNTDKCIYCRGNCRYPIHEKQYRLRYVRHILRKGEQLMLFEI